MHFRLPPLVLLAGLIAKASGVMKTLIPTLALDHGTNQYPHVEAASVVHLGYGLDTHTSLVDVALHVNHPTILLEAMDAVASLNCSASSVAMTFASPDTFEHSARALSSLEWSELDNVLFIVKQLGSDETEHERSFFLADRIHWDNGTFSLVASGQRKNVSDIASEVGVTFFEMPASPNHEDVVWQPTLLDLSGSSGLSDNTVLFSGDDLSATAEKAHVSAGVSITGYIDYHFLGGGLQEAYFDMNAGFNASLALALNATVPVSHGFSYTIPGLSWSLFHIPFICDVGPTVEFNVGVDVGVDVPVSIATDMSLEIRDGHIHLDLVNGDESHVGDWQPQHTSSANITAGAKNAVIHVSPYLEFTAKLGIDFFSWELDGGITAQPKFSNEFGVSQAREADGGREVGSLLTANPACTGGSEFHSKLQFSIFAFITSLFRKELYHVEQPIKDGCF
ncbi:hypothetical protein SLS62_007289 [Diatrype stigma]|uniref:DUF7029 domain-containing protein n=1 Tax=Diatrype stigma TaxID=117547 RepID=A0AAN9YMB7_9PEZI